MRYFAEFGGSVDTISGRAEADVDGVAFTVNGKFPILRDRFQPYGLVGLGFSYFSGTASFGSVAVETDRGRSRVDACENRRPDPSETCEYRPSPPRSVPVCTLL